MIGSLFGSGSQKKAIEQATQQQLAFQQKALDQQQAQFNVTQGNIAPWLKAGTTALGQQGDLLGMNGAVPQAAGIDAIKNSPYYQSLYRNGLEANEQNAAATGGIRGGNEVRSLADFGSDTLAQSIQQQLANLGGISGTGSSDALGLGSLSQANADSISNLFGNMGRTRAGGTIAKGNITAGMWGQAGGIADLVASAIPGVGGAAGAGFNLGSLFGGGSGF